MSLVFLDNNKEVSKVRMKLNRDSGWRGEWDRRSCGIFLIHHCQDFSIYLE